MTEPCVVLMGRCRFQQNPLVFDVSRKGGRKRGFLPERLKLFKDFACFGPRIERSAGSNPDSLQPSRPTPFPRCPW